MLAEFDPVVRKLLIKPDRKAKYLSLLIQNELISVLTAHLENKRVKDIKSAPFYSIITHTTQDISNTADTIQDISKTDQLSQIYRFVKIICNESGQAKYIQITETFLGFYECTNQTAEGISF